MMTIVHVNFSLETGGIETMLIDILNEQCTQSKASINLILINDQCDLKLLASIDSRVSIWRIGRPKGSKNPLYIVKLNRVLLRLRPTIIHCHNHQIAQLLWTGGSQRFLTIHDVQVPVRYFNRYTKLFAISNTVRQDVWQRAGCQADCVYNGIRTEAIVPKRSYAAEGLFQIVQISRLQHEKKGQHVLLLALHELVNTYQLTNLHLEFIGEGESRGYLEKLVYQLNLTKYVTFSGLATRTELYQNLHRYHLLVQPSLYEGFGLTVAEGMAAGVPVLVSDIDGPMELIDNDRYGYSFQAGNAHELAQCIYHVMQQYKSAVVQNMALEARRYARAIFDVSQTAARYMAHYERAGAGPKSNL